MLVDDLRTGTPDQLHCEIVKRYDLALEPNPIRQKDSYFISVIAKMLEEGVLKAWGALRGQRFVPDERSLHQSRLLLSNASGTRIPLRLVLRMIIAPAG